MTDNLYKCSFKSPGPLPYVCSIPLIRQIIQKCKGGKSEERRKPLLQLLDELHQAERKDPPQEQPFPLNVADVTMYHFWQQVERDDDTQYALAVTEFLRQPPVQAILNKLNDAEEREMLLIANPAATSTVHVGYVYAAWTPLFADMIKIGATMRQPYIRVAELAGSGVPEPFQLIASIPSSDPFKLEREIHEHFHSVRKYGRKKELFELSRIAVVNHFHSISEMTEQHARLQENDTRKRKRNETNFESLRDCAKLLRMEVEFMTKLGESMLELGLKDNVFSMSVTQAREFVKFNNDALDIQVRKMEFDIRMRSEELEHNRTMRSEELEHILAVARAKAEAIKIESRIE